MKKPWLLIGLVLFVVATAATGAQEGPKGTIHKITTGGEEVTIFRDQYGVPRIFAHSVHGLFFGDGFAVAQDRAWQMEKYRLTAEGRLAEVFGERFIDHDRQVRRDGLTAAELHEQFAKLPENIREMFQGYVDGVNAYLEEAQRAGTLPEDFANSNWKPERWRVEDCGAISAMMARRFGTSGTDHLKNLAVVEYLSKRLGTRHQAMKVFNDLRWVEDPAAITTVEPRVSVKRVTARLPDATAMLPNEKEGSGPSSALDPTELLRLQDEANRTAVYAAARELKLPTKWGSYSWLLAPSKSVSGNALLLGGPQMGFATPQIAHEVQLTGAGFDVMGMGFAGIPGVLNGMNNHLAWMTTSGFSHNEDIFEEELKAGDAHQYLYKGEYRQMEHRVEPIRVKDGATIDEDVYRTVHGPVVGWSPDRRTAYSKEMTYFGKEFGTSIAFLGFDRAKTIRDIPPLAAKIVASHNILVATQDGDIGYWHCGLFPVYAQGLDPRFPLRGTGEDDWKGMIPFDSLPQEINPRSGIIFNWNNKPVAGWKNYSFLAWGVAFQVSNISNEINRLLKARAGKLSLTDWMNIAPLMGRVNEVADWLAPGLIEAAERSAAKLTGDESRAIDHLRHWDNKFADGSIAQTIFDAWYGQLRQDLFGQVLGDLGGKGLFDQFVNSSTVYHALAGAKSSVPLSQSYLAGKTADEVRLAALAEALRTLRKDRGNDMTTWNYSIEWIKFDPLPSIPWYNRGTYIQAVELAKSAVRGFYILPPGESEDPKSPHYQDQLLLASWWMYTPMRLLTPEEAQ